MICMQSGICQMVINLLVSAYLINLIKTNISHSFSKSLFLYFFFFQRNLSSRTSKDASTIHIPIMATNATCIVRVAAVTNGGIGPFSDPVNVFIQGNGKLA